MALIRKYENRRLYDTDGSRYVNLDELAAMVRRGEPVTVVDVKTGRDLTRETLLQVVFAVEGGPELLPVSMLRRLIRACGDDPLQRMMRPHLASSMELLHAQLDELEARLGAAAPPYAKPSANPFTGANPFANLNPFANGHTTPASAPPPSGKSRPAAPPPEAPPPEPTADDDLSALRRRLDELEARLRGP